MAELLIEKKQACINSAKTIAVKKVKTLKVGNYHYLKKRLFFYNQIRLSVISRLKGEDMRHPSRI